MVNENIYNKFFDPTGYKYYWLTSRAVYVYSDFASFGVRRVRDGIVGARGLFDSDGGGSGGRYGVRPVVTLKSDVTIEDIQKIGEQQEPTWE